ncbi:MAG: helix-turn-helix transcriptional regulator [Clostridium sp.]|nr:helix-turn-helix transcriptional regulator [Clostridium sp.]
MKVVSIGENVIRLRKEKHLSRNDLARQMAGTTERNKIKCANMKISRIEENRSANPGVYTLQSIAKLLGVTIEDLLK